MTHDMIRCCKIPLEFDPDRLKGDLAQVAADEWTPHFNTREYEGDWSGVALRAPAGAGAGGALLAGLNVGSDFRDTPLLDRCPYFRDILAGLRCPVKSARLLKLGAGASIREHRDYDLGLEQNEVRVHIPVVTNPSVEFVLDGRLVVMKPGEAWYLDLSRLHRVRNRGMTDRVHLVVDCVADDWFRALLAAGVAGAGPSIESPPEERDFDRFRAVVVRDRDLQAALEATTDRAPFVALVERLGRERGFDFNASDVEDALREARRTWIEGRIR